LRHARSLAQPGYTARARRGISCFRANSLDDTAVKASCPSPSIREQMSRVRQARTARRKGLQRYTCFRSLLRRHGFFRNESRAISNLMEHAYAGALANATGETPSSPPIDGSNSRSTVTSLYAGTAPARAAASLIGSISLPGCGKGRKIRSKTSAIRRRLIASCLTDCDTTPFTHCMTFSPLTVVLYTVHPGSCFRLLPLVTVHYPPPSVYQRAHWPTSRLAN